MDIMTSVGLVSGIIVVAAVLLALLVGLGVWLWRVL